MLQVKIVEVGRNVLKEYGIEPSISGNGITSGNFGGGLASAVGSGLTTTPFSVGTLAYETANTGPISVTIRGLEEKGLLNTLAEPNLTAISGQHAEFLAGGEYPIPVSQQDNQITVSYKKFGVSLGFTPVVLNNDKIQLELESEVSTLSNDARVQTNQISIPSLSVRRAKTTIEMASGGSLMIAGLIQSDALNSMNSLPGINKLPIIGKLFSSQSFKRNESELLIVVTPYLVRPIKKPAAVLSTAYEPPPGSPQKINKDVPPRVHAPQARLDTTVPAGQVSRTNTGYWLE
jgi:pilus assembly protein CpaC